VLHWCNSIYNPLPLNPLIATETDPYYKNMTTEKKQLSQLHGEGDRITADFTREAAKERLATSLYTSEIFTLITMSPMIVIFNRVT